ncbi:MAG: hypothetical protein B6242_16270 [Anaerolineaceae bacterium 4572_78]|nr:MAG: hypothetical protein B6242_16270 [Anaerolineaceae bacterium 4572_78]
MTRKIINVFALAIIFIGFGLRTYQLGNDSFWNDEAGQAIAAIQPTVGEMLAIIRSHAMAMPFDYFVSRGTSIVGVMETIMRFPSVVWGTLTLALYFVFSKKLCQPKVALLTTWLLGLSAYHIHYSQEMRFYSALSFFYILSTLFLFRYINQPSKLTWGLFIFTTSLGSYFHPYVLLSIVNGFLYIAIIYPPARINDKKLLALVVSSITLGITFLPGYLYFGADQNYAYDIFQYGGSLIQILAYGLGWKVFPYTEISPTFGIWELLNIGFAGVGTIVVYTNYKYYKEFVSIIISVFIQIALIILADWIKGYWFISRQIVHLMPIVMILTSIGVVGLVEYLSRPFKFSSVKNFAFVGVMIIFGLSAVPRLTDYYNFQKSNGRQIVSELIQKSKTTEPIFVIPGYEEKIYRFYLLQTTSSNDIIQELKPTSWEQLQYDTSKIPGDIYLITTALMSDEQYNHLELLGFTPLLQPEVGWHGSRLLLVRYQQ